MLNIGKLVAGPGAGHYYTDQVARGQEDYYSGEGEAPGVWTGGGAAALGLSAEVTEEGIVRLLEGRDPESGFLIRRPGGKDSIAAFDLTFRAPKSVSILFGIAEPEVVRQVVAAHDAAVAQAMEYMEREACRVRRGAGGRTVLEGRGFVGAAFRHRSSRAGDPQLHTHVVVANASLGADGRWTAVDARALYRHGKTAGFVYQAALRIELTERLRVRWLAVEHGVADIEGIPRSVIEHFSRRRAEILEVMAARGEHSARSAQIATLDTRRRKDYGVSAERLREEWRARAGEHGLDRFAVRRVLRRASARRLHVAARFERLAKRLEGPEGLTRDRSRFTRRDVVQAFAGASSVGARLGELDELTDAFLQRQEIVPVESRAGEREFTTRSLLRAERELLDRAADRRGSGVAVTAVAVANGPGPLGSEQRELVVALTESGDGVQIVRSAAGTGKTFALGAAVEAWRASGVEVLGVALSARAACELRDQTGIDATTVARLKTALKRGIGLPRGAVLIIDEAGMVGTRDLAVLAAAAANADAKLVLVGDDRQLPEIQAGGAFSALAERLGAVELRDVRRQRQAWDREALTALRDGEIAEFAHAYVEHGQIVTAPTAHAAREAIVDDWFAAQMTGATVLMIAHRRADVADLNERAREKLRAHGMLGGQQVEIGRRAFADGDRVITTRNHRRLGLINGQTGVIAAIDDRKLHVRLDDGRRVVLPRAYVAAGHLEHGYATTAHRAQGATVDRTLVLGSDELYREWGYTALSRHRQDARFYVTGARRFLNEEPMSLETSDDVAVRVAQMLTKSRAKSAAGATRERAQDPLAWLAPEKPRTLNRSIGIEL
jgi:Ti-type conjugative transfer relaxase TraA